MVLPVLRGTTKYYEVLRLVLQDTTRHYEVPFAILRDIPEAYSEPYKTSKMERFEKTGKTC